MTPGRRNGRALGAISMCVLASACAGELGSAPPPKANVSLAPLHLRGAEGPPDPTVRDPRVLPLEASAEAHSYGVEPGGGARAIVSGVRIVTLANGSILAANDRLPQPPSITLQLPERLGGGVLFVIGTIVWRADQWLATLRPLYAARTPIASLSIGLDRVYARTTNNVHHAFNPQTGAPLDLGPWPLTPNVEAFVAADGWRALALADLRGLVMTNDAGATWRAIATPFDVTRIESVTSGFVVRGLDPHTRGELTYAVQSDGHTEQISNVSAPSIERAANDAYAIARPFGERPLAAAIEDGWPLTDGTALVARDGAIGRVRLADGALVDLLPDAIPLRTSRCHAVSLAREKSPGAFGFVCGEPHGATLLVAYDASSARLLVLHRWNSPRVVAASGNGAIVVHGGCASDAKDDTSDQATHAYCILGRDDEWREIHVRGDVGDERVVALADGRVAIISPPHGDLDGARITVLDRSRSTTLPLTFAAAKSVEPGPIAPDVARVLRLGVWMDGFEERRAGVLGGWIDGGGGVMLGIEITLDGQVLHGSYVRDAGAPMVSGRYGLGWGRSRRGYETTDGGMTWNAIEVPDAITASPILVRAAGPIGALAAGWLRVGWGASAAPPSLPALPRPVPAAAPLMASLDLECSAAAPSPPRSRAINAIGDLIDLPPSFYGARALASPLKRGELLTSFYGVAPPVLRNDERALSLDVRDATWLLGHIYAWGPAAGDWEHAHWIARWLSPYAGWPSVRSSMVAAAPPIVNDGSHGSATTAVWSIQPSDEPDHALMIARRSMGADPILFELESDRAPFEIHRADGEPFGPIRASIRIGSHWFLATQTTTAPTATVIWRVDGAFARELARVPRLASGTTAARTMDVRLAKRSDGRAIGLVTSGEAPDGTLALEGAGAWTWVSPVDLESGIVFDPEPAGASDLRDRKLRACREDDNGWIFDTTASINNTITLGTTKIGRVYSFQARVRVDRESTCVERIAAGLDPSWTLDTLPLASATPKAPNQSSIALALAAGEERYPLRCTPR